MTAAPTHEVGIIGARGRMGQRLTALASEFALAPTCLLDVNDPPPQPDDDDARLDCLIDFSVKQQLPASCALARDLGVPLVVGTTGLDDADHAALDIAAQTVPILWAPNFSVGVNVLAHLVAEAAAMLGEAYDVELIEAHHHRKVDAPSGTARFLAQRVAQARGWNLDDVARHGREGLVGARGAAEFGIHAVRGGSVVGDHQLHFLGPDERVIIEHRADNRDIFARGALRAARWLIDQAAKPGRYGMNDVLASGGRA